MEEGKRIRKLMLAAVATLVLLCAIPVSAATVKGFRTTVLKNQCVHLMNNNIQKNAISQYTIRSYHRHLLPGKTSYMLTVELLWR